MKYNSLPVNGARQSNALQQQITRLARERNLDHLAPLLTIQSVIDFAVSMRAILNALYAKPPSNGSELVLFDLNRYAKFGQLLRTASDTALARLLLAPPRLFRTTVSGNANPDSSDVVERVTEAGAATEQSLALGLSYPPGVYSLSYVTLPFPISDSLYGMQPDPAESFGI